MNDVGILVKNLVAIVVIGMHILCVTDVKTKESRFSKMFHDAMSEFITMTTGLKLASPFGVIAFDLLTLGVVTLGFHAIVCYIVDCLAIRLMTAIFSRSETK